MANSQFSPEEIIKQSVLKSGELEGRTPDDFVRHLGDLLRHYDDLGTLQVNNTVFVLILYPDKKGVEAFVFSVENDPQKLASDIMILLKELKKRNFQYLIGSDLPPGMEKILKIMNYPYTMIGPNDVRLDL